jgi:hypothetical protein
MKAVCFLRVMDFSRLFPVVRLAATPRLIFFILTVTMFFKGRGLVKILLKAYFDVLILLNNANLVQDQNKKDTVEKSFLGLLETNCNA